MNHAVWWPLLGAAIAGTVLAISFYLAWSVRFRVRVLGIAAELSFLIFLFCLGGAAVGWLLTHRP